MPLDITAAALALPVNAREWPTRRSTVALTSAAQVSLQAWREEMKKRGWTVTQVLDTRFERGTVPVLVARVSAQPLLYELPPLPVAAAYLRETRNEQAAIALGAFVDKLGKAAGAVGDTVKYGLLALALVAAVIVVNAVSPSRGGR